MTTNAGCDVLSREGIGETRLNSEAMMMRLGNEALLIFDYWLRFFDLKTALLHDKQIRADRAGELSQHVYVPDGALGLPISQVSRDIIRPALFRIAQNLSERAESRRIILFEPEQLGSLPDTYSTVVSDDEAGAALRTIKRFDLNAGKHELWFSAWFSVV
jgi:hypothetical protein